MSNLKENYLTEEKLGEILRKVYKTSKIIPQYKLGPRRKIDYAVQLSKSELHLVPSKLSKMVEEDENSPRLLFEFDGLLHYKSNKTVLRDLTEAPIPWNWNYMGVIEGSSTFMYRIPYWIQLDQYFCKTIFNIDKDFSDDYPLGFVSKKCPLPGDFSELGIKRFINEFMFLPNSISCVIAETLVNKVNSTKTPYVESIIPTSVIDIMEYFNYIALDRKNNTSNLFPICLQDSFNNILKNNESDNLDKRSIWIREIPEELSQNYQSSKDKSPYYEQKPTFAYPEMT